MHSRMVQWVFAVAACALGVASETSAAVDFKLVLTDGGKPKAVVVIPAWAAGKSVEAAAAQVLCDHLFQMSGARLARVDLSFASLAGANLSGAQLGASSCQPLVRIFSPPPVGLITPMCAAAPVQPLGSLVRDEQPRPFGESQVSHQPLALALGEGTHLGVAQGRCGEAQFSQ